ncbi:16S rRNA (guanine(527)-N(7))-methyltransferase RsmG [Thermocaproicibacter melissae]|uniref:16S rRNA (guanine(527)-N(7))-methyltransferase RsmG n=1 Tax=Thermocaproicibacter melissae TaxID=2966552 RepID=UPI0024B06274|nr:16S rRNA (guanine(527)-N(7))-methyltransferase RsmG [Thermocaproicibacter melissae]WBY64460.1 16S rRNA (guanine(527)-N(7))-methyltransferase RsmG [Thermocaproicibacter melissae]
MNDAASLLKTYASDCGIFITPQQEEQFRVYASLLTEWNEKINLTAVVDPEGIAAKHFLDSILILKYYDIPQGEKMIDVGTGAGFPGVPLKIMRPDLQLTLLDGLNKRLVFLAELTKKLGLEAEIVHARAEEAARQKQFRTAFGFATARAVAAMPVLCEYCLPFLRMGGVFAAMKGPDAEEEGKSAERAIALLGCKTEKTVKYTLPAGDGRTLFLIRRNALLAATYPRHGSKISKKPL